MKESHGHCWHGIGSNTGEDRKEICCFCGLAYDPTKRVPFVGHGKFAPDTMRPPKPQGICSGHVEYEEERQAKAIKHFQEQKQVKV